MQLSSGKHRNSVGRNRSEFAVRNAQGGCDVVELTVDTFNLRLFALLIC